MGSRETSRLRSKTKSALAGESFVRRSSGGRQSRRNSSNRMRWRMSLRIGKAPTAYEQRVVPAARATGADDEVRACVLLVERLLRLGMIRISFPV